MYPLPSLSLLWPLLTALITTSSPINHTTPTNDQTINCFRSPAWISPRFPPYVDMACGTIMRRLQHAYAKRFQDVDFEFLPEGEQQITANAAVRTPFKLVLGMENGSCSYRRCLDLFWGCLVYFA